jgi:hypothetical protein
MVDIWSVCANNDIIDMGGVQRMSIDEISNEHKKRKFHERGLQPVCAEHNSENGRTCKHICLFIDNRHWNAPIAQKELMWSRD